MEPVKKILVSGKKTFFIRDTTKDYHTQFGFVTPEDLAKPSGTEVTSHTGHKFIVRDATFIDRYNKIARAPQIIPQKDVGAIIALCGITRDSVIVDAGAGSGGLSIALAMIAKQVHTFDIREDHLAVVKKNIESFGLKNITCEIHNIYESIPIKDVDVVTLDVPEPWEAVDNAAEALKVGGFIVSYSPCIPQVGDFVEKVRHHDQLEFVRMIEVVHREWEVLGRKIRPKSMPTFHSGFIAFARKIKA